MNDDPNDRLNDELDAHDPLAALRSLPTSVEPERDLWPGIAARLARAERAIPIELRAERAVPIEPPSARRAPLGPLGRFAMAASLLAALALGWTLASRFRPAPVVVEVPAFAPAPGAAGVARTAYAATGRELDAIRDELRRAIEIRRDSLPPETRRLVFESLATIERAIGEIETALAAAPTDPDLARTYIVYRERQIDLLRHANRLAARL